MTPAHDHHHDHEHAHGHSHGVGHVHAPANFGRAFAIAAALNMALVVAQVFYGIAANSVALLADAGHNFGDVLGLLLAWAAHNVGQMAPTKRYTYGFRSASILSALLNGLILMLATGAIAWEAIGRFREPGEVEGTTVMIVAAAGIVVNGASAWLLLSGRKGDLNIRGAFLHLLGDAGISVGVIAAGAVIHFTHWYWVDPAASLVISGFIVWATWGLLRQSATLSLAGVPEGVDRTKVETLLQNRPGVTQVHDLHIWAMSTTETALTCHLEMPEGHPGDAFLMETCRELETQFGIGHSTLQIETDHGAACPLKPDSVV
jgi:cobalt-zinc-cadmium efflux system protein